MGLGASLSTAVSERTAVVIEDYMFDASVAGELTPEVSPSDFHDTWDLDGTDFTPEASPDDEGYWDDFSDIVTNGGFDADSDWTKNTGWTISGGVATKDGGALNYLTQDFTGDGAFEITFTVVGYVSGNVRLRVGTGFSSNIRTANGTYTEIIEKDSASFGFYGEGELSIDNVSVTEYAITPLDV